MVTYDGRTVSIDLTNALNGLQGVLALQLVNGDSDIGSSVRIQNLTNVTDAEGVAAPALSTIGMRAAAGPAVDLAPYNVIDDGSVAVQVTNIRLDRAAGRYLADLQLRNLGGPLSRALAVRFRNLPAGVELVGASGQDPMGIPYLNRGCEKSPSASASIGVHRPQVMRRGPRSAPKRGIG